MQIFPSVTATQLKNETGSVLDQAARGPVKLTSHGRPRVYLVPAERFEQLIALEDALLAGRATRARKEGMIGPDATMALLRDMIDASAEPVAQRRKVAAPAARKARKTARAKTTGARR